MRKRAHRRRLVNEKNGKVIAVRSDGVLIVDYNGVLRPRGINPGTGKRFAQFETVIWPPTPPGPPTLSEPRWKSRRERAMELRARMDGCGEIRNAGWLVRDAYFGPRARLREMVKRFLESFAAELRRNEDFEAVLFAAADALFSSPLGVPWEP